MTFRLTKHHGLGNDFLVWLTDDPAAAADRAAWIERARQWCDRSRGVGADGLIIGLRGQPTADLVMTLINADGSAAEMSGNGIRCLAQAEAMRRGSAMGALAVSTDGGRRDVVFIAPQPGEETPLVAGSTMTCAVDMGPAGPGPTFEQADAVLAATGLDVRGHGTYDVGNPHLVVLVDDPFAIDVATVGPELEAHFSAGMNVHFVAPTPTEPDAMDLVVWERGAGITEACGTGATAVARAAHDWGLTSTEVAIHMPGGDVAVTVAEPMILRGPATHIADVEVPQ